MHGCLAGLSEQKNGSRFVFAQISVQTNLHVTTPHSRPDERFFSNKIYMQIVEECEERLQPEQVEELLAAIQTHLQ